METRTVRSDPLRLAVIGCGAVAEKRYLPAADLTDGVEVTHLVDLDLDRARSLAREFGVPGCLRDHRALPESVEAVVVATPPETHAEIAIDCLRRGVHVLCEKPLAVGVGEAESMVRAAGESGARLSVAMVRRLGGSASLLKRFVGTGMLGRLRRVEAEEGGAFNWPLRTGHIFRGAGGVLSDTGTHLIDLALWVTGISDVQVTAYRDDSLGGVEANAYLELELRTGVDAIPAAIEVSFTRDLDNRIRVIGDNGALEGDTLGGSEVRFYPADAPDEPIVLRPEQPATRTRVEDFVIQLERFAQSARDPDAEAYVPAHEALPTISVVERCRALEVLRPRIWELPPEPHRSEAHASV